MDFDNTKDTITPDETGKLTVAGTGGVVVPVGTTAQRPDPQVGLLRYNSERGSPEVYVGGGLWGSLPVLLDKSAAPVTLTANGNVLNYTVPGNTLLDLNFLRVRMGGTWSITGTSRKITPAVRYGGTIMWSSQSMVLQAGQTVGWGLDFQIVPNGAANSQFLTGFIMIGLQGNASVGNGRIDISPNQQPYTFMTINGTSAVNSANDQALVVDITFNGAGGNSLIKRYHTIEKL